MGKFTPEAIYKAMKDPGIVPLFTHDDPGVAREVIDAAYEGGMRVFEFTNRRPNSYQVFCELIAHISRYPDLMLGIGTIMDPDTTRKFIDAGAHFIISPILNVEMAPVCHQAGVPWLPGCATLTEIVTARRHGSVMIKVFPGSVLGPGFVSAIMPVIPDLQLMITGGVEPTEQNLSAWFKAGASCVGMGSQLFRKDLLETKNWSQLQKLMRDAADIARKVKKA